jgi:hypothetical protein
MKILRLLFFLIPFFVHSQKNNLEFYMNSKIEKNKDVKIIYNDANVDEIEDNQYSQILSKKLLFDLNKNGLSVIFPVDLKEACLSKSCTDIKDVINDFNYYYIYINTQNTSTRTSIVGAIYFNGKVIGGFTAYRSYWTNSRFEDLSDSICEKIIK